MDQRLTWCALVVSRVQHLVVCSFSSPSTSSVGLLLVLFFYCPSSHLGAAYDGVHLVISCCCVMIAAAWDEQADEEPRSSSSSSSLALVITSGGAAARAAVRSAVVACGIVVATGVRHHLRRPSPLPSLPPPLP